MTPTIVDWDLIVRAVNKAVEQGVEQGINAEREAMLAECSKLRTETEKYLYAYQGLHKLCQEQISECNRLHVVIDRMHELLKRVHSQSWGDPSMENMKVLHDVHQYLQENKP